MEGNEVKLTREVKNFARQRGADLVGIADPKRLDGSPDGHPSPFKILPKAKAIIVMAKRFPHGAIDSPHPPMDGPIEDLEVVHGGVYVATYMTINFMHFQMAYEIANYLETEKKYKAAPISPTVPRDEVKWVGTISLRKAAEEAGLGEIGVSQLLITPQWGPRVRFSAVITAAPLIVDGPKLVGKVCSHCNECTKSCPVRALTPRQDDEITDDTKRTRNYNRPKCVWGAAFGFYKASGGMQPPDEWANAKSMAETTALMPKYKEMYPAITKYINQSLKVMGYPNCCSCMQFCEAGIKARDRDLQ